MTTQLPRAGFIPITESILDCLPRTQDKLTLIHNLVHEGDHTALRYIDELRYELETYNDLIH